MLFGISTEEFDFRIFESPEELEKAIDEKVKLDTLEESQQASVGIGRILILTEL